MNSEYQTPSPIQTLIYVLSSGKAEDGMGHDKEGVHYQSLAVTGVFHRWNIW